METSNSASSLLTKKDKKIEEFLVRTVKYACSEEAEGGSGPSSSTSCSSKRILELAQERLNQQSILLAHKFNPILKEHIAQKMQSEVAAGYSRIVLPVESVHSMALLYQEAVNGWLDSDRVSFETSNSALAGRLEMKDCFILHYFSFLCCYRCESDNLFALAVTGCSTSGKTVLFENPTLQNAHSFVGEVGVGRYSVGAKSLLLYSDIGLERLLRGTDGEKFKTLARTERTACKIHSHTEELPPVFVFLTSNQNVHRHTLPEESGTASFFKRSRTFPSTLDGLVRSCRSAERARMLEPLVAAVKNRVLEAFVSQPPLGLVLPTSGKFQRIHAILGLYSRVCNLLLEYEADSFYSLALPSYVLTGLMDHATSMLSLLDSISGVTLTALELRETLRHLAHKFFSQDPANLGLFLERLPVLEESSP